MIDYQIQTTASDGKFTPAECVKMAKDNGLISIAITDHDTIDGVEEGLRAGKEFGVEVIPGIELSCAEGTHNIHILGYGINYRSEKLAEVLNGLKNEREFRAQKIVARCQELGWVVDYDAVKKRSESVVTRPHIAAEIMENPANAKRLADEGIKHMGEMFEKYLGDHAPAYVHHVPYSAESAIKLIREVGGVSVWSHPTIPMGDYYLVEETLKKFIEWGLDGIETIESYFTLEDTKFLYNLSKEYNLLHTAGSDFHDVFVRENDPEKGATRVGGYKTFGYPLEGIREALLAAIEKRRVAVAI